MKQNATPRDAAELLTQFFLGSGSFEAAGQSLGQMTPRPAQTGVQSNTSRDALYDSGFSGLAVESVGYSVSGQLDDKLAPEDAIGVHIYVARGSKKFLSEMPSEIGGVPCTIHNIGRLSIRPHLSSGATNRPHIFERNGRAACGSSCAPSGSTFAGTLGAFIKKANSGTLYAISNNHVFADCNHMPVGQPIMVPSSGDSAPGRRAPVQVCTHSEIVELRSGTPALVAPCREDLAIAEVPDPTMVSSWQGDDVHGYDTPTNPATLATGLPVKKWGRTSGLTHGIMQSVQARTALPYQGEKFKAVVWFRDVWIIRSKDSSAFALPGDSGSLVVTDDAKHAVGIVFAASPKDGYALVVPIDRVLQSFGGISLVNNHGL